MKVSLILKLIFYALQFGLVCEELPAQEKTRACKNELLNGDASDQAKHWHTEGPWVLFLEENNNNNTAFKLWNTKGATSGYSQFIAISKERWNDPVTLSGWVKRDEESTERLGSPIIEAVFLDEQELVISSEELSGTKAEWELLSKRIWIPENTVTIQIRLKVGYLKSDILQGGFTSYFDNVAFNYCDETLPRPGVSQ